MTSWADDPDIAAMQRLAAGDDLALNEIMERWTKPVGAFLARLLGHPEDAVDLTQETFVAIYRARNRYRPSAKFSTWLFGIASNLGRQHLRWRSRHPEVAYDLGNSPLDGERGPAQPDGEHPRLRIEAAERAKAVKDAVLSLPVDMREAVLLFEYENLPHVEIARILRCSTKAVETRLYRARKLLREKLSRHLT